MRLVFMGTPDFAVETLKALIEAGHEIACVYSQPPRPAGPRHGGAALAGPRLRGRAGHRGADTRSR